MLDNLALQSESCNGTSNLLFILKEVASFLLFKFSDAVLN